MSERVTEGNDLFPNPNLIPFNPELSEKKEEALINLGKWWEGKIVAKGQDIANLPFQGDLELRFGTYRGYYTLVTHHTKSEESKAGILELGGVVYLPDTQQTLFYGQEAGRQLRASLGETQTGQSPYGKVRDAKTFTYLHPIPYDLYDDAEVYLEGPEGFALARAFSHNPPNYDRSRARLEQVLQAPWELLDASLTTDEGIRKLQQHLPQYANRLEKMPDMVHELRMTENRYLVAIV